MGSPILELQYISRFRFQDIIRNQNHSSKYEGPYYYLRAKFFSSAESREASASLFSAFFPKPRRPSPGPGSVFRSISGWWYLSAQNPGKKSHLQGRLSSKVTLFGFNSEELFSFWKTIQHKSEAQTQNNPKIRKPQRGVALHPNLTEIHASGSVKCPAGSRDICFLQDGRALGWIGS